MPVRLSQVLVVGISSRALFDLEEENRIFDEQGLEAYSEYQLQHEDDVLPKGTAFSLVQALLKLNEGREEPIVEVVVMSRNSPETGTSSRPSGATYEPFPRGRAPSTSCPSPRPTRQARSWSSKLARAATTTPTSFL